MIPRQFPHLVYLTTILSHHVSLSDHEPIEHFGEDHFGAEEIAADRLDRVLCFSKRTDLIARVTG